jgi:hypothetical protein
MMKLIEDIQNEIRLGVLSFKAIAIKYEVAYGDVMDVWYEMCEQES